MCLGIGIILTAACGGSSGNGGTGGTAAGGTGGGGSGGGGSGGGSMSLTGACANLTCLNDMANLLTNCQPSGTCTQQASTTGTAACYSNGVKLQTGVDMSTFATTMTAKNGSSVCYSMAIAGLLTASTTIVFKNPAGTTVGTIAANTTTGAMTVTCPGGTATVVDDSCGSGPGDLATTSENALSGAGCTQGACSF
jgi:hypothetical protein